MRVCLVVRQFPAISETFIVNQAVGLLQRGHEVVIVPQRTAVRDLMTGELQDSGLMARVIRQPAITRSSALKDVAKLTPALVTTRGRIVRAARAAEANDSRALIKAMFWARRLQQAGYVDLIHSHFGPSALFAVAARRAGVVQAPIVATFHGSDVTVLPKRRGFDIYRSGFQEIEALTVGSTFIAGEVVRLGATASKVHVVPQGVDTRTFARSPCREELNRPFTVVTVARLVEVKGVDVALRAIASASTHVPDLRYVVVGDGPERPGLERHARELRILDRVTFLGAQDRAGVIRVLERSDVFLLSGVRASTGAVEGQGLAILEAMATGLPAIVSDIGGPGETVRQDETGFLVPERDVEGFARRIVELATQSARRRTMGNAASMDVARRFSLDGQLDELERLYQEVLVAHSSKGRAT
jgi:colanic acid/amylovoran biosynthesis glycosyltransferase